MTLQSVTKEIRQFEDCFFSNRCVTIEDQENEYEMASPEYLDQTCVFSAFGNYNDVTPQVISRESLCTVIVRSPRINLSGYYPNFAECSELFGDSEVDTDRFELQVTSKKIDENKLRLFDKLFQVFKECSNENWDGYDATRITRNVYLEAEKFISLLPSYKIIPEIIPEPTGEIAFEWYRGKRFVFIASVGGKNLIAYAGLYGKISKIHGTEYFGNIFPPGVIRNIHRLFEGAYWIWTI